MTQMLPTNVDAEMAVLGAILTDPDAFYKVDTILVPQDFYLERHRWLYEVYAAQVKTAQPDLITLSDALDRAGQLQEFGGMAYMTDLIVNTPMAMNVEAYAAIVERTAVQRRLIAAAGKVAEIGYKGESEDPDELTQAAQSVIVEATLRKSDHTIKTIRQVASEYFDNVEARKKAGKSIIGIPTGFPTLDRMLCGLQPTRFYTLAGRPGMGKSALALAVALNAANAGKHVGVFSFEMGGEQLFNRWVAATVGIDSRLLYMGQLTDNEWPKWMDAVSKLAATSIYIDDGKATLASVVSKARVMAMRYGLDLLIIDYLQLMNDEGGGRRNENREQEVGRISRGSKSLAMELKIPLLAVCQLNRAVEQRKDKHAMLSDLRESGTLEQDSDVVMAIYRDEYYNPNTEFPNVIDLDILKWRDGPVGRIPMFYRKETNQFHEIELLQVPLSGYTPPPDGFEPLS